MSNKKTYLSDYWVGGRIKDLNAENMSETLKFVTTKLYYTYLKGISIDILDTNLLKSGGSDAL